MCLVHNSTIAMHEESENHENDLIKATKVTKQVLYRVGLPTVDNASLRHSHSDLELEEIVIMTLKIKTLVSYSALILCNLLHCHKL